MMNEIKRLDSNISNVFEDYSKGKQASYVMHLTILKLINKQPLFQF